MAMLLEFTVPETDRERKTTAARSLSLRAGLTGLLGVLGLVCLGLLLLPKAVEGEGLKASLKVPADVFFEQKASKTDASKLTKSAEEAMEKSALMAINEVFSKIVVPKFNTDTIPETVQKQHDDPMAKVVDSSKMHVTDLEGLSDFKISSIIASSVSGSGEMGAQAASGSGFSGQATVKMEMEGAIAETMTANAVLYKDGKIEYQGTLSIEDFKMKMSMTAQMQTSTGASLTPSKMMESMKDMTIQNMQNGAPSFSMKCKISCGRRLKFDMMHDMMKDGAQDMAKDTHASCHAAQMAIDVGQPAFNLAMGLKFQSIFQKSFDKQFPMTLGDKTKTSGTVAGSMAMRPTKYRLLAQISSADPLLESLWRQPRRLSAVTDLAADTSTAAVVESLAKMAHVPPDSVHVRMVPDEANGQVQIEYNISVPAGSGADVYDVQDNLRKHSEDDISKHISESMQAKAVTSQNVTIFNHQTHVLNPELHVTTPFKKRGFLWDKAIFIATFILSAIICTGSWTEQNAAPSKNESNASKPEKSKESKTTRAVEPSKPEVDISTSSQPATLSGFPLLPAPALMRQLPVMGPHGVYMQQQYAYQSLSGTISSPQSLVQSPVR